MQENDGKRGNGENRKVKVPVRRMQPMKQGGPGRSRCVLARNE